MFSPTDQDVPMNNQHLVNRFIHHNCLGDNNEKHDTPSDYCVSQLCGGKRIGKTKFLSFTGKPFIVVTSTNHEFMNKIIMGANTNRTLGYGMELKDFSQIDEVFNDGWNDFFTLSPILIKDKTNYGKFITVKNRDENGRYTIDNPDYVSQLRDHIVNKFSKIDPTIDFTDFELKLGNISKVKPLILYKENINKYVVNQGSSIKLSVKGNKKILEYLYHYGVGQSTGAGFGTIYKAANSYIYKF